MSLLCQLCCQLWSQESWDSCGQALLVFQTAGAENNQVFSPPRVQKSCGSRVQNSTSECSSSLDHMKYNIWQNFDSLLSLPKSDRYKHRQGCSPHTASELLTLQGGTVFQLPTKRLDRCQQTIPLIQPAYSRSQVPLRVCQQVVTGQF